MVWSGQSSLSFHHSIICLKLIERCNNTKSYSFAPRLTNGLIQSSIGSFFSNRNLEQWSRHLTLSQTPFIPKLFYINQKLDILHLTLWKKFLRTGIVLTFWVGTKIKYFLSSDPVVISLQLTNFQSPIKLKCQDTCLPCLWNIATIPYPLKATRGGLNANFHISCWPPLVALTIFAESSQPYGPWIWWSPLTFCMW